MCICSVTVDIDVETRDDVEPRQIEYGAQKEAINVIRYA